MTSVPASVEPSLARAQSIQEAMLEDAIEDNTPAPVTETPGSEHEDNVRQRLIYVASSLSIFVLLKCCHYEMNALSCNIHILHVHWLLTVGPGDVPDTALHAPRGARQLLLLVPVRRV